LGYGNFVRMADEGNEVVHPTPVLPEPQRGRGIVRGGSLPQVYKALHKPLFYIINRPESMSETWIHKSLSRTIGM